MRNWAVARARSGTEISVCDEIRSSLGLDVYCPMFVRWRKLPKHLAAKTGKKKELVRSVLYNGYIFVQIPILEVVPEIKAVRNVMFLLSNHYGPLFASSKDIEAMRGREATGINDETENGRKLRDAERLGRQLAEMREIQLRDITGRIVRLESGLLAGRSGVVISHDHEEGTVKVDIGKIPVHVSAGSVAVIA